MALLPESSRNALTEQANELERRQGLIDARRHDLARTDQEPDPDQLREIQQRYDGVYRKLDLPGSPPPQKSESSFTYTRRLLSDLQAYCTSQAARSQNLFDVYRPAIDAFERQILEEATAAAEDHSRGNWDDPDQLREIVRTDTSGRQYVEWAGNPGSWMSQFSGPAVYVSRWLNRDGNDLPNNRRNVRI